MWDSEAELDLWRDICTNSLFWFTRVAYGMDFHPRRKGIPYWFTPRIHKPICDSFCEWGEEWLKTRRSMNIMLVIPRFFGKTTLLTISGQLWLHVRDSELSTYTGSESVNNAIEFVESAKKIVDGSDPYAWFTYLYGNWYDKEREWRRDSSVHAARIGIGRKEPSFGTWGVEKGITGRHPDGGFFDDPTSYEAMASHSSWFQIVNDHMASLMPVFADNSIFVVPGTRYGDGDHIGAELKREGICELRGMPMGEAGSTSKQPIRLSKKGKWRVYYLQARDTRDISNYEDGEPIFPERCSHEFLKEFERKNNLRYWAQMMNDPAGSEYNPLSRERVEQLWVEPKHIPKNLRMFMHIDTAFKRPEQQAKGDLSTIVISGQSVDGSGVVYFLETWGSATVKLENFLDQMVKMYQKYAGLGRRIIAITDDKETGGHERSWELHVRKTFSSKGLSMPMFFPFSRSGRNKISRIIRAAGFWAEGFVYLQEGGFGLDKLVEEMVRVGNSDHDDYSDAAADAFHSDVYRPPSVQKVYEKMRGLGFVGDDVLKSAMGMTYGEYLQEGVNLVGDDKWEEDIYEPV